MRMFSIAPHEVDAVWGDFAHHFERFERVAKDIKAEQIREAAKAERLQIWGLQDAEEVHGVAGTEILDTAEGLVCVVRVACGTAPKALQERLLDEIGKWARELGCVKVRYIGRRGWLRWFPRFRQTGVVAEWNLRAN